MMCPMMQGGMGPGCGMNDSLICFGVMIFLLVWIIFVPIVITSRLEKIVKLLEDKK